MLAERLPGREVYSATYIQARRDADHITLSRVHGLGNPGLTAYPHYALMAWKREGGRRGVLPTCLPISQGQLPAVGVSKPNTTKTVLYLLVVSLEKTGLTKLMDDQESYLKKSRS